MSLQEEIAVLKLKKARIFGEIEMLSTVNDIVYTRLGKTVADIMRKEKELLRNAENHLE